MVDTDARKKHIVLHSHATTDNDPVALVWACADPQRRGPVVGTLGNAARRHLCRNGGQRRQHRVDRKGNCRKHHCHEGNEFCLSQSLSFRISHVL